MNAVTCGYGWTQVLLWNLAAFPAAFLLNSFIEWGAHRFVMHKPFIPYAFKHQTSHHMWFGSNESYHALTPDMLEHGIGFSWREYIIFPFFCSLLYIPIQYFSHRPVYFGALFAVFFGLMCFDILHRRFHNPKDTWFQRSGVFRFLKEHHRLHHADMTKNFNVVFPLADLVMGTLKRGVYY